MNRLGRTALTSAVLSTVLMAVLPSCSSAQNRKSEAKGKNTPTAPESAASSVKLTSFANPHDANHYDWGQFPAGQDPRAVGKRLVTNFLGRSPNDKSKDYRAKTIIYPEACTVYGCMRFDHSIQDKGQLDKLLAKYQNEVGENPPTRMLKPRNVDSSVTAIIPLEMYLINGKSQYRQTGEDYADAQWDKSFAQSHFGLTPAETKDYLPQGAPEGLTWQTRYWVDDMFMITGLEMQTYRATHNQLYLDRAATEMISYLDKLQQPNGLFFHEFTAPYYWGRGNGWFAVGMAELLSDMPENHPQRARIMEGYKKMMAALKQYQAPQGYWRQLIDDPKAWGESSGTGMFTFAIATGVRHGWLDDSYKETARKGWGAVCKFLDKNANVRDVCVGTNRNSDRQFYLDRPRETGNLHGQAAAIWAAWSMLDQQ